MALARERFLWRLPYQIWRGSKGSLDGVRKGSGGRPPGPPRVSSPGVSLDSDGALVLEL
jgi:hypothetical protein